MNIKERKLFFTRNGEYTVWEMLNALNENYLKEIFMFVFSEKRWTDSMPDSPDAYPWFLYTVWGKQEEDGQEELYQVINAYFIESGEPKSDFNAHLYIYQGFSLDFESIVLNLSRLKDNLNDFEINDLKMEFFLYPEIGEAKNVLDIRFTSEHTSYYLENQNLQSLNSEIRIYLDLNMALMTNYSNYTHSMSDKNKFIKEVFETISSHRGAVSPKILSDQSLRYLLTIGNTKESASKLKFEIDGQFKINIDVIHPTEFKNLVNQEDIGKLYNRYPLTQLKVRLSETEEKYLMVIGDEGKLLSRAQTIETSDINKFIYRLGELLKYDYLNVNYLDSIKRIARRELIGTDAQKNNTAETCYKGVRSIIKNKYPEISEPILKIITNAFFFCIKENHFPKVKVTDSLSPAILVVLKKITGKQDEMINSLFSALIEVYCADEEGSCIIMLNQIIEIEKKKAMPNASGF